MFHSRQRTRTRLLAAGAVLAASTLLLAACSSGGTSGGKSDTKNYAITFLPKNLGNAYFDTSDAGGKKAVGEFKGTYAEVGPATAAPDAQVSFINTLTQQHVGAIVLSSDDPTANGTALNAARKRGNRVVAVGIGYWFYKDRPTVTGFIDSITGPPAKMNTKLGRKVNQVATHAATTPASRR